MRLLVYAMRFSLLSVLLAGLLLAGCRADSSPTAATAQAPTRQPAEYTGPDERAALATFVRQQSAPVLLDFYADWCGPCRRLRAAMPDERVAAALQPVAVVKLDVDSYPVLAREYDIEAIPTLVKLDASGRAVARLTSAAWDEDTPANIAPVLRELVSGHR